MAVFSVLNFVLPYDDNKVKQYMKYSDALNW